MTIPLKYSIRNLTARKVSTFLTMVGITLVVVIFISVLSLLNGLETTMVSTASADNMIVLSSGSQRESSSQLSKDVAPLVRVLPDVRKGADGVPWVSEEFVETIAIELGGPSSGGRTVAVRGADPVAQVVHDRFRMVNGSFFKPRAGEIVAGAALAKDIPALRAGNKIRFLDREWTVSGTFEAGKTSFESELWMDRGELMDLRNSKTISSITVKLVQPDKVESVSESLARDPRLKVKALPETAYYAEQNQVAKKMRGFGYFIAVIMSVGAIFAAMNTLYASLSERIREVGTLRSLGFSRLSIMIAFLSESLFMALSGGLAGCLLATLMNGYSMSVMDFSRFVAIAFEFKVTPEILGVAMLFAFTMGFLGGLLPAVRAARLPVVQAMRAV